MVGVEIGLRNATNGLILAEVTRTTLTVWERVRGLLASLPLQAGEALVLHHCNNVHTFGMRYPILVVYADRRGVVLYKAVLKPNRFGPWLRGAFLVAELPASIEDRVRVGDQLEMI